MTINRDARTFTILLLRVCGATQYSLIAIERYPLAAGLWSG
jgi:hypothetical protein